MILRRIAGSRQSEIVREWEGETVAILGGGPSMTSAHVELVREAHAARRLRCVAINDAYLWADFADLLYAADASWHRDHTIGIDKSELRLTAAQVRERYQSFVGLRCANEDQLKGPSGLDELGDDRIHVVRNADIGLVRSYNMAPRADLTCGYNSLHQGMNIAIVAGVKRCLLLGCDGGSVDGRTHFHGGHGKPIDPSFWEQMRTAFSVAEHALKAMGVEVINCSVNSRIDSFPKMPLESALEAMCVPS